MIRIGIDGREITLNHTGIHRYMDIFLCGVSRNDEVELHIFLPRRQIRKIVKPWIFYHFTDIPCPDIFWGHFVLPRLVKKYNIDVFFSPYYKLPLGLEIPSAVTVHDIIPFKYPNKRLGFNNIYKWFFKLQLMYSLKSADIIFTDSMYVLKQLKTFYPDYKGVFLHNPIPADPKFFVAEKNEPPLPFQYIFYVGNMMPHKNIDTLLKSYATLNPSTRKNTHLVLTGRNRFYEDLSAMLDISETTHFLGFISDEYLPCYYKHSLFAVVPSYEEGYGFPVLEAQAAGKSVIASNTTSLPEVGGDSAIYFQPNNFKDLAEKMRLLIKDQNLRQTLEKNSTINAKKISHDDFLSNILNGLRDIVKN